MSATANIIGGISDAVSAIAAASIAIQIVKPLTARADAATHIGAIISGFAIMFTVSHSPLSRIASTMIGWSEPVVLSVTKSVTAAVGLFASYSLYRLSAPTEVLTERTEVEHLRTELEAANKRAESAIKTRDEFMAFLCHELRNPLHVVSANADFLAESKLSREQRDYVRSVTDNAHLMSSIVNDVLDISRLQAGLMNFICVPVELRDLCQSLIRQVRHQSASKQLNMNMIINDNVPQYVLTDPTRIHQILLNLITNAIKFTPIKGSVTLEITAFKENPIKAKQNIGSELIASSVDSVTSTTVSLSTSSSSSSPSLSTGIRNRARPNRSIDAQLIIKEEEKEEAETLNSSVGVVAEWADGDLYSSPLSASPSSSSSSSSSSVLFLQFRVSDTGCGISSSLMPQLFSPYSHEKLITVREHAGTGLGLSIVHQIIKNMRGHIHVHSRLAQGSVFTMTIAMSEASDADIANQQIYVPIVKSEPPSPIDTALSVAPSLSTSPAQNAQSSPSDPAPSELSLLSDPSPSSIPLLPPTRFASSDNDRIAMGLSQMSPTSDLRQMIRAESVIQQNPSITTGPLTPAVLVVDDNDVNRKILSRMLASLGYRPVLCCDGLEAVAAVRSCPASDPFLCVFMDISMPNMDGYEATRHIRAGVAAADGSSSSSSSSSSSTGGNANVYIIALTANALADERLKAKECGMNDFATKPIRKSEIAKLLSQLSRHIPHFRRVGDLSSQHSAPAETSPPFVLPSQAFMPRSFTTVTPQQQQESPSPQPQPQ